jgi:hypothetical protein
MSTGDKERLIGQMQVGKAADFVYNHLAPILSQLSQNTVNEMKTNFREVYDAEKQRSLVAKLVAFDDIESKLRSQMNLGMDATKKIQGDME